jgi:hypothetical protein
MRLLYQNMLTSSQPIMGTHLGKKRGVQMRKQIARSTIEDTPPPFTLTREVKNDSEIKGTGYNCSDSEKERGQTYEKASYRL